MSFRIKPKTVKGRFYSEREQEYFDVIITGHTEGKFIPGDRLTPDEYPEIVITEVEYEGVNIIDQLDAEELRSCEEIFAED